MTIECPVCHTALQVSGVDSRLYFCPRKAVFSSEAGTTVQFVESIIYLDPEDKPRLSIIEVPPYTFVLRNNELGPQTTVSKIVFDDVTSDKVELFTVNSLLDLPWDNKEKLLERMGLYILFS